MPFPFTLPTTSSVLLSDFFDSVTHPSLPLTATTKRSVLKDVLKKHKRLSGAALESNLPAVQNAVQAYVPYLLALNAGAGDRGGDDGGGPEKKKKKKKLDVEIKRVLQVEWRSTLSTTSLLSSTSLSPVVVPGGRAQLTGVHHEIAFTLSTLAYTSSLLARSHLRVLYGGGSGSGSALSSDQRTSIIATAMKHLMEAHGIHTYLLHSLPSASLDNGPIDIQPSTISALASLALAEATIIVVAKDDPYTLAVSEVRNAENTDWMFKAPSIPKVRAHLYARFCLAAAEHANTASSLLSGTKIDEDVLKYATHLRSTARGKAARFLAIDAELASKTGEALAWLQGARKELGLAVEAAAMEDGSNSSNTTTTTTTTNNTTTNRPRRRGLQGLKHTWLEKREDRKIETGSKEWGKDAGRLEEARVVEMLESKWTRENNTINMQIIPPWQPLLANLPSGREYHHSHSQSESESAWRPTEMDPDVLARMRAPPAPEERAFRGVEADSGDDEEEEEEEGKGKSLNKSAAIGAFPGTGGEYGRSGTSSTSYY